MSAFLHRQLTFPRADRSLQRVAWLTAVLTGSGAFGLGLNDAQAADGARDVERGEVEEVIVTAQRREQRLQDVPIAVSVLGGDKLDSSTFGVTGTLSSVPGVATLVGTMGGGTQLIVRGVTAASSLLTGSAPIGYYLDSVPFGLVRSAIAPDANAYDLDRIEVLRGPQGTLYGANAQNGVVRVLSRNPDLSKFELKVRSALSTSEDGGENYRGDMAVNVPIVEGKLAARAVAGYESLSGWIDRPNQDDANEGEIVTGRLKVSAQPTDNLSIGLSAWLSRTDFDARSTGTEARTNPSLVEEPLTTDYDVYGLRVGYDFSSFSLTSTTSYLEYENRSQLDYATVFGLVDTILHTGFESEVFAEEVNLQSTQDGPWAWSLGGIYRDGEDRFFQWRRQYLNPNGNRSTDTTESYAVFGELTRAFADGRFEVTGGLRYFEDRQVMQETSRLSLLAPPPEGFFRREGKFDALSPRVVFTWHPADSFMTYVSYGEGFRSGFSQLSVVLSQAPEFPPVDSDNLINYEWGAKGGFAGGRLSLEAAVYYIDWEDIQQQLSVQTNSGTGTVISVSAPINGDSASGVGAELALRGSPVEGLQLGVSYSWNDLTLDSDVVSSTGTLLFREDDRLSGSPEQTVGFSADYGFAVGAGGYEARIAASASYTSEIQRRTLLQGVSTVIKSDDLLIGRASLALESPGRVTTTLFVDNVNDEKGSPNSDPNPVQNMRIRPRTAGIQFEYRF